MTARGAGGNVSKAAFDRLSNRVKILEGTMATIDSDVKAVRAVAEQALASAEAAAENSAELLAIAKATKGTAAFLSKHGPRIIAFVTGILAAGEIGDPKIIAFLQSFFS